MDGEATEKDLLVQARRHLGVVRTEADEDRREQGG